MAKTIFSPASQSDLGSIAEYVSEELGNPKAAIDTVNSGTPLDNVCPVRSDYRFIVCDNWMIFYWIEAETPVVARVLWGSSDYVRALFDDSTGLR